MNFIENNNIEILVSIVMPAYNAERFLSRSIDSVIAQSYKNWELIIVNDASLDNTLEIARQKQSVDSRIVVLSMDRNGGVAAARNLALENSRGKYIAFLDSDDLWESDKLHKQVEVMESRNLLVTYGSFKRIDENDNYLGTVTPPRSIDYKHLLKSNFIGNLTGMYNAAVLGKQYFLKIGHEDYVAWLALVRLAGKAESVGGVLGFYRVYGQSISANKVKAASWQWKIYRESENIGVLRSLWYMVNYVFYAVFKRF